MTGLATLVTDRLRIIQRAEYHRACMQGLSREAMLDYLEGVFEACPIMTGVFPRADELVIVFRKGGGDLLQAAAAGRCFPIGPLEAVPCVGGPCCLAICLARHARLAIRSSRRCRRCTDHVDLDDTAGYPVP